MSATDHEQRPAGTGAGAVKVLVAEDEESFVDALAVGLGREGFEVSIARDGTTALELFDQTNPDLVLLDIMLPKLSGIDVCRAIRARSSVPIIMVTAKGTEIDTVVGLEVGADDYVTKPYRLRELVARMRAVLRRAPSSRDPKHPGTRSAGADPDHLSGTAAVKPGARGFVADEEAVLEVGEVRLEPDRHRLFVRGAEVQLRRKEFELLAILMSNAGRVMTRDLLIDRVWGHDYVGDTKTLDVHIKRLRSHIELDPSNPVLITTVRGVGYRYEVSPGAR